MPSVEMRQDRYRYGRYLVGWIRIEFGRDDVKYFYERSRSYKKPAFSMNLYVADRDAKRIQPLQATYFDKKGVQIDVIKGSSPFSHYRWEMCIPNTSAEAIWEALMEAQSFLEQNAAGGGMQKLQ